jgi:hypothetical protein
VGAVALAIVGAGLGGGAKADVVGLIDFESFSDGSPNGQFGWSSLGSAGSGCALYDHQIVSHSVEPYPGFGLKSLRMSNAVTSGCFGDHTFSVSALEEAGETEAEGDGMSGGTRQEHFMAEWDFASADADDYQEGLSVVASPDRGDGARMSWIQMQDTPDGLAVNFYDLAVTSESAPGHDFVFRPLVSGLDREIKHTIKVEMTFKDGAHDDKVKVYVDGKLVGVGGSWEDYFREGEGNPSRTVDSILFRTGGRAQDAVPELLGRGFLIDNLRIETY